MRQAFKDLLGLVYTPTCAHCGAPLVGEQTGLCVACQLDLPTTGFAPLVSNPAELRLAGRIPFVAGSSFLHFSQDNPTQHLVHHIKYRGHRQLAISLGRLMGHDLACSHRFDDVDLLLPVPLHRWKLLQRRYNQSLLLCNGIAEVLGLPINHRALVRTRFSLSQTHLSRIERIANMQGIFAVRRPEELSGKHVLVVDDVLTTGATLEACCLALQEVADIRISFATLALAGYL